MSQPTANCPNCGAPIQFRWSSAVQTTCQYCQSILVRTDVDLKKVGEVADLPLDASPLQLGSEGIYGNKPFVLVGRIIYDWEQGSWNEWHIGFNDGTSGWLSDAQLEYAVSFLAESPPNLPGAEAIYRGKQFDWHEPFTVTSVTRAHYRGVEGDLPFQYWDKHDMLFADLRTATGRFATVDYSEDPPLFFTGESVAFESLKLKNLRSFEGWD